MIDPKKTDEAIPKEILDNEQRWFKKSNGYFGLLVSGLPNMITYTLSTVLSCVVIAYILVSCTNITGYNQINLNREWNESNCTCNCWDAFYRGKHPRQSYETEYKYVYFNYKLQTLGILILVLYYFQLLSNLFNKILRHLLSSLTTGKLTFRPGVLILLSVCVYSNYWNGWNLFNFINDRDQRFLRELGLYSVIDIFLSYLYFNSLDRFSLKIGNYKPITMPTIAPVFCLNGLIFYIRFHHRVKDGFFQNITTNPEQIEEAVFFLKEILGFLFAFFAWRKTNRPLYSHLSKSELKGKGALFHFGLWTVLVCGLEYLRQSILTPLK